MPYEVLLGPLSRKLPELIFHPRERVGGLGWPMWSVTDTDDSTVIFVRDFSSANSFNELFEKDYFVGYSTFITDDFPVDQLWDHEILHIHISDIENPDELFRNDNDDL